MDTNWHQKEPSRALKLQISGAEIWNWARNEKWYKNDIKSREGQNFDIISQLYHPLKNDIKISLSSKKWYNDMIVYQWYNIFQCLCKVEHWTPALHCLLLHVRYRWNGRFQIPN
jgi:hypothetical protein